MSEQLQQGEYDKHTIAKALGPRITDGILAGLQALGAQSDNLKGLFKIGGNGRRIIRVALHSVARFAITEMGMSANEFNQQSQMAFNKAYQKVAPKVDVDGDPSFDESEVCEDCGLIECSCGTDE